MSYSCSMSQVRHYGWGSMIRKGVSWVSHTHTNKHYHTLADSEGEFKSLKLKYLIPGKCRPK